MHKHSKRTLFHNMDDIVFETMWFIFLIIINLIIINTTANGWILTYVVSTIIIPTIFHINQTLYEADRTDINDDFLKILEFELFVVKWIIYALVLGLLLFVYIKTIRIKSYTFKVYINILVAVIYVGSVSQKLAKHLLTK